MKSTKVRLDRLLVERGLAETREKAQGLILAGQVLVNEQKVAQCGAAVSSQVSLRLLGGARRYVSRAGLKLEGALDHFHVDPSGKVCLDIGSSTGGFTECLLERGALRVIAVDVGTNQLDWKLRRDPRITLLERTNARYLTLEQLGVRSDLVTIDVSFISATLILPVLPSLLNPRAELLVLVKPQFEVGKGQVGKGGIVRDPRLHQESVARVSHKLLELGFTDVDSAESILPGTEGNREYFLHALWRSSSPLTESARQS
jgi:23S rRNA (cytidine1920-2'-O)/16S rRNA (cytidine1409-2'-O)-methyltransferase